MFSSGNKSITLEDILEKTSEADILNYYLGINRVPILINSPLRQDKKPSMGIFSPDGEKIYYIDFSTKEKGSIYTLLSKLWCTTFGQTLEKIYNDVCGYSSSIPIRVSSKVQSLGFSKSNSDLKCKVREWKEHDIEYWESYGIGLKWLKYAEVYPISHTIIIKDGKEYVFGADKYAYAYVEHKEGKTTIKIYQPFNKKGFKWCNKHDRSVISLWTKVPEYGKGICICSSLKDALCLWANTGIPSIAVQGEGYTMSNTAINELKRRFEKVFILFDNDKPGLLDGEKLASLTGFTNIVLPQFNGGKDVSDYYQIIGDKELFKHKILKLFGYDKKRTISSYQGCPY